MSSPATLAEKLMLLLAYAQRGSLDLPDGLIDRECSFSVNGTTYESTLGPPSTDPIARLLAQGPVAYRFLLQGLRYALPDLAISLEGLQGEERSGLVTGRATIAGTLRGSHQRVADVVGIALVTNAEGWLTEVGVQAPENLLRCLAAARTA